MSDQEPELLTDDELRADLANGWAPHGARLAYELLLARARITELEAVADRNSKLYIKAAPQLAEARGWATWFAAERDQLRARITELEAESTLQVRYDVWLKCNYGINNSVWNEFLESRDE